MFGWSVEDKFGAAAGRNGNVVLPGNAVGVAGSAGERSAVDGDQAQLAVPSVEENSQIEIGVGAGVEHAPEFAARRPGAENRHRVAGIGYGDEIYGEILGGMSGFGVGRGRTDRE